MEFHISRAIREAAQVDDLLFSYTGNVVFANVAASRRLAKALNAARLPDAEPAAAYNAGALFAMGLIDELSHALIARYRREIDPNVLSEAVQWFSAHATPGELDRLLLEFTTQFPNVAVFRNQLTARQWLDGMLAPKEPATDAADLTHQEAALEELLLLWIANLNPAFKPFAALFEDRNLRQQTVYPAVTSAFPTYLGTRPPFSPEIGTLFDALRAPSLASPDSLTGQLDFIRTHWTPYLGSELSRILLAVDTLREEDLAIWMRFNPPGPDQYRHGAPTFGSQGFEGDEYMGFEAEFEIAPDGTRRRKRYAEGYQAPLDEYENFSADQAWMPNVVLIAKSTYVWLEQLSKKYGRHIHRLDHIPDEELRLLAQRGMTGLWLIGLWERSVASQTIKRLRGHHDSVASAYSLKSYDIAQDLGGWDAYNHLKHHAAMAGLRLASDMVPNHMGIDSPWVIDHPDWFIQRSESPFPAYSFHGPDLSTDPRVEIKIDDHYYDQTDAAVAFRLRSFADGSTRFIYHGNDGTTFAWNDTAQLDYSKAFVREHVIQTILHVARLFPIIRFDAAMVLAKRHVQRLWFPLPGAGGSIPSRAEDAMSQESFDALMPHEFWREVVDRVAAEVPGTLLLAEAFWMLEGYFVRTLGMHRVYNSAFMNMLRDEENAKYRSYLKKTMEFDPDILKRYVNFMSNPDERTTIDQFGDGDKCFGVATLMSTLPGLPMFGHGQVEGFTERYGMEYKTAKMDEWPNEHLVARHQREIAPLLKDRRIFAGSEHFALYDFWNGYGSVNENVFAYSNRYCSDSDDTGKETRSLVLYNNSYERTDGTIHLSVAAMNKGAGELRQTSIVHGLNLSSDESITVAYRDQRSGLHTLRRAADIANHGLHFSLGGFGCLVLLEWRQLRSTEEYPWDRLCDALHGSAVPSLDDALANLRLSPLHDALRNLLTYNNIGVLAGLAAEPEAPVQQRAEAAAANVTPVAGSEEPLAERAEDCEAAPILGDSPASLLDAAERLHLCLQQRIPGEGPKKSESEIATEDAGPEELLRAVAAIPALIEERSASWPAGALHVLPGGDVCRPSAHRWAPALAYAALASLPTKLSLAQFDHLRLRNALADAFAALGIEGEARWQAAARVRLLLMQPAAGAIHSADLFHEPDVRWLCGANDFTNTVFDEATQSYSNCVITYFNKEQFEELLVWLQLPALLDIAQTQTVDQPAAVAIIDAQIATASAEAQTAGFNLDAYLGLAARHRRAAKDSAAPATSAAPASEAVLA